MDLGFRRESNHVGGVLWIGSERPGAFKNHVNVFGGGCLGLRRWGSRRLGLITRNQEERCQNSTDQGNQHAGEVAAGRYFFFSFLPTIGLSLSPYIHHTKDGAVCARIK